MPPLAHLLAPQIMARAKEFEAALGPPEIPRRAGYLADVSEYGVTTEQAPGTLAPQPAPPPKKPKAPEKKPERVASTGYLGQTNVGFEKTPYDPRGLMNKPEGKSYGGRGPGGQMMDGIGIMQRSGDPIAQKVARGFLAGIAGKVTGVQGAYRAPQAGQAVDGEGKQPPMQMLVPLASSREPIGYTERGEAIYAAPPAPVAPQRGPMKLKRGEAAGFDEKGESVDPRGHKLGYLTNPTAPMGTVRGEGRELPLRDTARRKTDAPMDRRDKFGAGALQQLYTPHLKALQENFQDTGKEAFPPGYFNGMTPAKRKDIEDGVKALKDMERGQPA
jgi:hypothetical protein